MSAAIVSLIVQTSDARRLAQVLPGLAAQAPAADLVVVGLGGLADVADVVRALAPDALLVQARDASPFAAARNLGAAVAQAPWLFFLDEGVGLQRSLAIRPHAGFVLAGAGPADRSLLVATGDFRRMEGYDELIGDPDAAQADLLQRLARGGVRQASLPAHGLTRLPPVAAAVSQPAPDEALYRLVKADLVRLGSAPDAASRRALQAEVRATLARAAQNAGKAELHVHFRHARAGASAARASLTYGIGPAR